MRIFWWMTLVAIASCRSNTDSEGNQNSGNSASGFDVSQSKFDEHRAYRYIEKQVSFGPRAPTTPQHKACAEWLLSELEMLSDSAYFQEFTAVTYDGKKHQGRNILAKLNPSNPNRILLAAHWDTRPMADRDVKNQSEPILGADDAGSGVGIILSLLHALKESKPKLGIDIVFFDIEDYGQPENSGLPPMENSWCLGSQYWGKNYREPFLPRWGVLLDMVGSQGATFAKEEISMLYASNLANRVWNMATEMGYGQFFTDNTMGSIQDDHMYINTLARIPTVDIINYNTVTNRFGTHWHTHRDDMKIIDKKTLKAVGSVLEQLIYEEDKIIQ